MPVDPDKFGNTKRMKVVYVENNEKKDTELMTSPGKVKLDKNSPTRTKRKAQDEKKEPPKKKSSSPAGRSSQELSAIMEEMVIFLTGESSNERSRYAKAIKFPSKVSKKARGFPRAGDPSRNQHCIDFISHPHPLPYSTAALLCHGMWKIQ